MDLKDEGVDLQHVDSRNNMADILTKCLANKKESAENRLRAAGCLLCMGRSGDELGGVVGSVGVKWNGMGGVWHEI